MRPRRDAEARRNRCDLPDQRTIDREWRMALARSARAEDAFSG
jgi:hypothetical protein